MKVGTLQCAMVCLQSKDYIKKINPFKSISIFKIVTDFQWLWEPCNVQWCVSRVKIKKKKLSPLKVFSNFKIVTDFQWLWEPCNVQWCVSRVRIKNNN